MEMIPAMVTRIKWKLQGFKWKQSDNVNYFKDENITGMSATLVWRIANGGHTRDSYKTSE